MTRSVGWRHSLSAPPVIRIGWRLLLTLAFNTLIAVVLTIIDYGDGLFVNLVFSHCIGISIFLSVTPWFIRPGGSRPSAWMLVALLLGSVLGVSLALLLTGKWHQAFGSGVFMRNLLLAVLFGGLAVWVFMTREWLHRARAELHEQQLRDVQMRKGQVEARLRMLQAQVEPHFIFNTLAHLMSLIDSDPARGKEMLDHLIDYLRTSLSHARRDWVTIAEEMEVVDAYLAVLAMRTGERMRVEREIEEAVLECPVPPMLLQPLVENAIKHGIEPRTGQGNVVVGARREDSCLVLEVRDDGPGFSGTSSGSGHGIVNLRERLQSGYGECADFVLEELPDGGVMARITIEGAVYE